MGMNLLTLFCHVCVFTYVFGISNSPSLRLPVLKTTLPPVSIAASFGKPLPISSEKIVLSNEQKVSFNVLESFSSQKEANDEDYFQLSIAGVMICGALSRSMAALVVHPLHAVKVNLQLHSLSSWDSTPLTLQLFTSLLSWNILMWGLGTQLLMTLPHGALSFAVTESTKRWLQKTGSQSSTQKELNSVHDLLAAGLSSLVCSIISVPQMVLTDRIMAGLYPSLGSGVRDILQTQGVGGFYRGWLPSMLLKLPSSAMTWTIYQQLRQRALRLQHNQSKLQLASVAAAATCIMMTPLDTVKTRLVTQRHHSSPYSEDSPNMALAYSGVRDCFSQVLRKEGWTALFSSLPPRLLSVVPMIAIQYATYEFLKAALLRMRRDTVLTRRKYPSAVPAATTSDVQDMYMTGAVAAERQSVWRSPLSLWAGKGGHVADSASAKGTPDSNATAARTKNQITRDVPPLPATPPPLVKPPPSCNV